jgi:hypothetical protein
LPAGPSSGNGIYAYDTTEGVRYRFVFRQSDGTQSNRRGFTTRRAAATARRRLVASIERGEVKASRATFGEFWARLLEERRPYLTAGSMVDYETHGRRRLLPAFGSSVRRFSAGFVVAPRGRPVAVAGFAVAHGNIIVRELDLTVLDD